MSSLSIHSAAQMLRLPEPGLRYLRHDRAASLTLDAGGLTVEGNRIATLEDTPAAAVQIDATGAAVLPGFVDCHTHLPFAGWRAGEYEQKVTGVPYEEIARGGGGIQASARAFAEAPDEVVLLQAHRLAREMLAHGTTTFETKSGYGLSEVAELRALRLASELSRLVTQDVVHTALLAHAVPPEKTADEWMDTVAAMVPKCAVLGAAALDIYVESIAFTNAHLARIGALAREHGLALRAHVEQFATHRSVPVAIEHGARSVDHLACLHADDLEPLARSETAAVLLPGAELMGAERVAPARELADAGAICVVATDANPGTSPIVSLPLIIGIAVRRYGWSVREALLAVTLNAAYVAGVSPDRGALEPGRRGDVVILDGPAEHVPYRLGHDPVAAVVIAGELAWVRPDQAWRVSVA